MKNDRNTVGLLVLFLQRRNIDKFIKRELIILHCDFCLIQNHIAVYAC